MAKPTVKAVLLSPQRELGTNPLLVVGPSLGTSTVLWTETAALLGDDFDVIGWDLPGHGISPTVNEGFDVAELADAVVDLVDSVSPGARFHYAGVSLGGGATGLQLGIKHGDRLLSLSVQCSGAKLGTPEGWLERAETVRKLGTPPVMIQAPPSAGSVPDSWTASRTSAAAYCTPYATPTASATPSAARPSPCSMSASSSAASPSPHR